MTYLVKENEAIPANYPSAPFGLSSAAAALSAAMIWQRIESYIRERYTEREIVWIMRGNAYDEWSPPLSPITSHTAEIWRDGAWVSVTLPSSPIGYELPCDGTYRVTAQIGGGTVPEGVTEAFRRLAEYMADDTDRAGVSSYSVNMGGAIQESYSRNAAHAARALQYSGAADLLRTIRRQK